MSTQIKTRRDTYSNWTSVNPILGDGEIGYDKTNNQFRVGDGVNTWNNLPVSVSTVAGKTGNVILDSTNIAIDSTISTLSTIQDVIDVVWSSGVIAGGDVTDNGDGTINISSCDIVLRTTASSSGNIVYLTTPAVTNLNLVDNSVNYIGVDYNNGSPVYITSTSMSIFNCLDKCFAWMITRSGIELSIIDARAQNVDSMTKTKRLFMDFNKYIHANGGSILGTSGLYLTVSSGSFYFMINKIPHTAFDTSVGGNNNENVFSYYYRDGIGGFIEVPNSKQIDNLYYDNGTGTLETLGSNKYGVHWVYFVPGETYKLCVVYGTNSYSQSEALVATQPSTLPNIIANAGILIGRIIVQKSATSVYSAESAFAVKFSGSGTTDHNSLSNIQGGITNEYYHFTNAEHNALIGGNSTSLHYHDITKLNSSINPTNNNDMVFELTSDTQLTIKVKGTDGIVRSTTLTLS